MVEVINKVEPGFGSALITYACCRSEPLAGFSGQAAIPLVKDGRGDEVFGCTVDAGAYA